jgi:hypothetical protein
MTNAELIKILEKNPDGKVYISLKGDIEEHFVDTCDETHGGVVLSSDADAPIYESIVKMARECLEEYGTDLNENQLDRLKYIAGDEV